MSALVVGFVTGVVAVLVPGVVFVPRVLTHATRALKEANAKHCEARQLFVNAQTLKADEDRVAELAFYTWALEQKFVLACREIERLQRDARREARRTQRVPRLLWALAAVGAAVTVLAVLRWVG